MNTTELEQRLLQLAAGGDIAAKGQLIDLWNRMGVSSWERTASEFIAREVWSIVPGTVNDPNDGYAIAQSKTYPRLWTWHQVLEPGVSPHQVFAVAAGVPDPANISTFHEGATVCVDLMGALRVLDGLQYIVVDDSVQKQMFSPTGEPLQLEDVNDRVNRIMGQRITETFAGPDMNGQ